MIFAVLLSLSLLLASVQGQAELTNRITEHNTTTAIRDVWFVDATDEQVSMVVILEATSSDTSQIQISQQQSECSNCNSCASMLTPECVADDAAFCNCNTVCRHGVCSVTVAPVKPGRWYIGVFTKGYYKIRVEFQQYSDLTEGNVLESRLASVRAFEIGSHVTQKLPWWDYYRAEIVRDGTFSVTVTNLEDSGPRRGFVHVYMRKEPSGSGEPNFDSWPDETHNDALYSTKSRDIIQGHVKNVRKGEGVLIGVLGSGKEDWIRYSIHTGGFDFAEAYAVVGIFALLMLLGTFVFLYKRQAGAVRRRHRPFHSRVHD